VTDLERGDRALRVFHSFWKIFPESRSISYEKMLELLKKRPMGGNALLEGIGAGIREAEMPDSRVDAAMKKLAAASGGKLPAKNMDFFNFLMNESIQVNFVDAVVFTVKESVKDVAKGAQAVGNQLIFTGKMLNFLLPAIALIFVLFWLNKSTGGSLGRAVKGLRR
jgi:hypothetical protein